jgi:hypothetical protein
VKAIAAASITNGLPATVIIRNKHRLRATHDTRQQAQARMPRLPTAPQHGKSSSAVITRYLTEWRPSSSREPEAP